MAVDHDTARHLERRECCGAPFSQPHQQALESSSEDHGIPPRDNGYQVDFCEGSGLDLPAYSGADYAEKSNDRSSVSGTVITLGGAAIRWARSAQRCVTSSTAEAEDVAHGEGVKKALLTGAVSSFICPELSGSCVRVLRIVRGPSRWVRTFLRLLGASTLTRVSISLRELLRAKNIDLQFVAWEEWHEYGFTKSLAATTFKYHRRFLFNLPLEGKRCEHYSMSTIESCEEKVVWPPPHATLRGMDE